MNPDMMRMAMESLSKLTPEQMADMQRQMANLPPSFLQQQMQAMNSLPPEVLQQRMAEAGRADPAQVEAQLKQATMTAQQQQDYQFRAASALKDEGNKLFGTQRTPEAVEKYLRARDNLKEQTSNAARDLRTKCALNLASCYLRLGDHPAVVRECSEVLATAPGDCKALYRRGQARLALRDHARAASDLRAALASATDADRDVIQEKLAKAEEGLAADQESKQGSAAQRDEGAVPEVDGTVSEVAPEADRVEAFDAQLLPSGQPQPSFPAGSPGGGGFPAGGMPNMDPAQMRQMLSMLRDNPGIMQHMRSTLDAMTPEQLQAAARMNGGNLPPGMDVNPEAMRGMVDHMANMGPSEIDTMMAALDARATAAPASSGSSSAGPSPASMPFPEEGDSSPFQQAAAAMQANPELVSQAMDMFSKMDPETLAAMSRNMGGMGPVGAPASPGAGMPGMQPDAAAMQQMLKDPQAVKMMHGMMSNMSAEQLVAMSKASGQELSPEQAEMMASKMKNMSEEQVQQLLKAASWLQRGVDLARQARDIMLANKLLVLGVIMLVIAVLLRHMGVV